MFDQESTKSLLLLKKHRHAMRARVFLLILVAFKYLDVKLFTSCFNNVVHFLDMMLS